jgi:hypothetical protein
MRLFLTEQLRMSTLLELKDGEVRTTEQIQGIVAAKRLEHFHEPTWWPNQKLWRGFVWNLVNLDLVHSALLQLADRGYATYLTGHGSSRVWEAHPRFEPNLIRWRITEKGKSRLKEWAAVVATSKSGSLAEAIAQEQAREQAHEQAKVIPAQ